MSTRACGCPEFEQTREGISRRAFLSGMLAMGAGIVISNTTGLRYALAASGDTGADVIITLSMRGGMDGLMAVPILGDMNLRRLRPTISVLDSQALLLDRTFGLHPSLTTFKTLFDAGELSIVHAAGTPVGTRSHFDDQNSLELAAYGTPDTSSGWLNRYLQAAGSPSVLSGIAVADQTPVSLFGEASAMTFGSLDDVVLSDIGTDHRNYVDVLTRIHARSDHKWSQQALSTLGATEALRGVKQTSQVVYPKSATADRFKVLASLLNAGIPIKTANIDSDGEFDVHSAAGVRGGTMSDNFTDLSATIAAFKKDLGPRWARVTIVTLTEFGRRLEENSSAGVDHGWASAIFVMGGGVKGGQVVTDWPGLADKDLRDGDLAVTIDYRHVLAEVLRNRGGLSIAAVSSVLPSFTPKPLDITHPITGVAELPRQTSPAPTRKPRAPVHKRRPTKKPKKK
jgi:uncharacterized protein (DUF1501 family)